MSEITVSLIKNSNVAKLKFELNKRGLSTHGKLHELSAGYNSIKSDKLNIRSYLMVKNIK